MLFSEEMKSQEKVKKESRLLIEDFDFLCNKLETVHPDIYAEYPQEKYSEDKNSILSTLQNDMTPEEFYVAVAAFVASIKDGHTNVMPFVSENRTNYMKNGGVTIPLRIVTDKNTLKVMGVLSDTDTEIKADDTILSINGVPASEICGFLYGLVGSEDNNYIKDKFLANYISTFLWYKYDFGDEYTFVVENDNNGINEIKMKAVTQEEAVGNLQKLLKPQSQMYSLDIDSINHKAVLIVRTFFNPPALETFFDEAFDKIINQYKVNDLTIDVRDNGGGSSASVDLLLSHLTRREYRTYSDINIKISADVKEAYQKRHPNLYEKIKDIPDGDMYQQESLIKRPGKEEIYTGKLTVLCNEMSYSGASTFVSLVECLNLGKIIGKTGQGKKYFADFLMYKLPNTHLEFTISTKQFTDCI